jgi:hypothetical protein
MSEHVREIARKFDAVAIGIVDLRSDDGLRELGDIDYPDNARFAIVSVVPAPYDPIVSAGIGGQVPVQNGLLVSFILSAYLRESGYFATMKACAPKDSARLAARAGLGTLDATGRLSTPRHGMDVWVADIVYTDFPLQETR